MRGKLSFSLPILCSLFIVGRVFWNAGNPLDVNQANTRHALEAEKKTFLKQSASKRNLLSFSDVEVYIRYDEYADDLEWALTDENGKVMAFHKGNKTDNGQERVVSLQVPTGKYYFEMKDSHGDGMCCRVGDFDGHYKLSVKGKILAIGGEFADTTGPIGFQTYNGGDVKAMQDTNLGLQPDCLEMHPDNFNICLYLTTRAKAFGNDWLPAFQAAKKKWETLIVGDYTDPVEFKQNIWQRSKKLDGIFITGEAAPIDGEFGILGSSGPRTMVRTNRKNPINRNKYFVQTLTGEMTFDSADIGRMLTEKTYRDVIIHEMGHVLGLGTMWELNGLHSGKEDDPVYNGVNAQREYTKLGFPGKLEVEVDYGPGTAGGHWDEECLRNEVMTGMADPDMKFSTITVGGIEDLGFNVDYSAADHFKLPKHFDCDNQHPETPIKRVRLLTGKNRGRILSSKVREAAISYGELEMQRCREQHENMSLPRNVVFIGDRLRHVLVEEDGHIYAVEVRGNPKSAAKSVQSVVAKGDTKLKLSERPLKLWGFL